jgi:hypothetical protein
MRLIPIDWFYIGLSKDYGVTFKTDLAVGLYGISINPTTPSFDVAGWRNYMFLKIIW